MPLHILQLGPYPPPEGGVTRNVLAIHDALANAGHTSTIIATTRSSRTYDEPNVYHPATPLALIRLLTSLQYDILHLHIGGNVNSRILALALAALTFGRNKSVLTFHSGGYPLTTEAGAATRHSVRGFIFRRFSRIIAVSRAIADVFHRYGVEPSRIRTISPFTLEQPDEAITVPEELSSFYRRHSPILLAVGGLEKEYDPHFQISAAAHVIAEFPNAGLIIVGDGSMREEVEKAIATSGIANHIFLAGDVEHAVTLHLIRDADVLLRTTLFDGDAISVRESLHLGTPVIATKTGSRPDGIYEIEAGDAKGLLDGIRTVLGQDRQNDAHAVEQPDNIAAVIQVYEEIVQA